MKTKLFSILLIAGIMNLNAAVIEKTYFFNDFQVTNSGDFQLINFSNTKLSGMAGEPSLPYHAVSMLLPPGHAAQSIEIIGLHEKEIPGIYKLFPGQYVKPISGDTKAEFVINQAVYNSSSAYPATPAGMLSTEYLNGYALALSVFTPIQYYPASGRVTYFSEIKVKINSSPDASSEKALENLRPNPDDIDHIRLVTQNHTMLDAYPKSSESIPGDYEILIVTPQAFCNAFESLRYLYLKRGLRMNIISTDSVYNEHQAVTPKESIRNFIIQEYQNHGIQYVLLGGDIEHIPYAPFYCTVQSSSLYQSSDIPADLYYSALDGTWNDDGDSRWGEMDEDDLLPELAVGRLPFSSAGDLDRMLHKIIQYQDYPVLSELDRPLLAGEKLWTDPDTWGCDYMDLLLGHHEDNGYITNGIPDDQDIQKLYDRDLYPSTWSNADLLAAINSGTSFVHHSGHADYYSVMKMTDYMITNENFTGVNGVNHNYTLVYTHGCNCGGFDQSDCIAERMVFIDNFAAAFVGNSRYGWFNEGTTEGPSEHLHREFVDALFADRYFRIGRTHMESKIASAPWVNAPDQHEPGALRWCYYDCNLLGDPAMGIWTDEPVEIIVDYPEHIDIGSASMTVSVMTDGNPAARMTCTVIQDSVLLGAADTDSLGFAEIIFDKILSDSGRAELFVSGYNRNPVSFPVHINQTSAIAVKEFIPVTTSLLGNYPNPFNGQTTISYQIAEAGRVQIALFNALGQEICLLEDGFKNAGKYKLHFDAIQSLNLPSGIYFYSLTTDRGFVENKKLILLK